MTNLKFAGLVTCLILSACGEESVTQSKVQTTTLSAPAELIALDNAQIGPPSVDRMWQFKIQKMSAENDYVKKGDVVIQFDGQRLKNDLIGRKSQLNAEIKKGENNDLNDESTKQDLILALAEAEMNYEKAKRKVEIVDVSRSEIDKKIQQADFLYQQEKLAQAKQKLEYQKQATLVNRQVSQGRIKKLRQRVQSMTDEIKKLSVKAPKDGLVMYLEDWNGEKAAEGETVYMGRMLIQLPSLDNVALKAEFAEPDIAKLSVGQQVKVLFDAYPEMSYMGKIAELGQAFYPKSAQNPKVVFEAEIELGEARPEVMRPGMKAKIEVVKS
ncbi:efflux RND transporter periplasmic adaptor subunit [Paraglaciecola aquimarina]|uniref:Efflux RND transporter periplasmic adaptor subunit n=1 Tax=Paraglaciecola algarum TaxID=3050085 RepID=A0ABS9D9I5_9ALTE|nr:efflux RND transporter periplasmic adaptor subunit [Paraglaciecola sp. G1-23]MCF2949465.1 efflux RND transporter periplasmic adaptor subunit [Paraglaciecola sp. G1-23]